MQEIKRMKSRILQSNEFECGSISNFNRGSSSSDNVTKSLGESMTLIARDHTIEYPHLKEEREVNKMPL